MKNWRRPADGSARCPAAAGDWLLVACEDDANEISTVPLADGAPVDTRRFDLKTDRYADRGGDAGATYARVHPGGRSAGVVLGNRAVTLVRFALDEAGVPIGAQAEPPTVSRRWLAMARWTGRGDHFIVADTGWGSSPLDAAFNKNGEIVSFALSPHNDERGVVSTARVSKSPEAFEINRTGDLIAVVNMERTYLPGGFPTGLFGNEAHLHCRSWPWIMKPAT